ncbi:MAG: hypothetical protein KZQ93_04385 [Candidatus Thiodiazotropha sp. (ex Monitilora ramsayi)]|nr:hypothetical protein [Candidatus Thiodiazotropha sp. (ex Monitilora ramsayi)]
MFKEEPAWYRYIDEARGFLNALRFLSTPNTTLWINKFPINRDFEHTVDWYVDEIKKDFVCKSKSLVGGKEVKRILRENVFDKLVQIKDKAILREYEWQFYEYYGLASTSIHIDNPFSSLSRENSYLLELTSKEYRISACLVTPVGNHIVVVTIGELKT